MAIVLSDLTNGSINPIVDQSYTNLEGIVYKILKKEESFLESLFGSDEPKNDIVFAYFDKIHSPFREIISDDNAESFLTQVIVPAENVHIGDRIYVTFNDGDYRRGTFIRSSKVQNNTSVSATGIGGSSGISVSSYCTRPSTSVVDTAADNASALSEKGVSTSTFTPAQPTPVTNPCVGGPSGPPVAGQIEGVPFKNIGFIDKGKLKQQRLIVMHQSVTSTADVAHRVLKAKNCSVHFTVDRNGSSEQNLEIDKRGVHAGGMNPRSIAIEHINPARGFEKFFKKYQLQDQAHYEASYQIVNQLCEITKIPRITLPYSYAASSKGEGWFLAQGKLPVGYELSPNISGIIAHGVSTVTDHTDGLFETLYVQYRFLNNDAADAWKKASITLTKIKEKEGLVKGETIEWKHKNHKTGIVATIKTQNYFIKLEP